MKRLSSQNNWDYLYQPTASATKGRLPERFFGSYSEQRFWSMVGKHLPYRTKQNVLEIGCAPGTILRDFARRFDCVPHGVDFSQPGVELTRDNFDRWGYNPGNVIHADVFDVAFQNSVAGKFDVVLSRGFVEHFDDLHSAIGAHKAPLRPGGLLVVTIPNFRGLNYFIGWKTTVRDLYPMHNFEIMNVKPFREAFDTPDLQILSCGYFGGFDLGIFDTGVQTALLKSFRRMQAGLNLLFRIVPPPNFRWTSPQLLCIARKLAPGSNGISDGEVRG